MLMIIIMKLTITASVSIVGWSAFTVAGVGVEHPSVDTHLPAAWS